MQRRLAMAPLLTLLAFATVLDAQEITSNFFTASDGTKIHYLTGGEDGSWVVLIHGFTSSAQGNWVRQGIFAELATNHRVVAIDTRNHGKSDRPNPGAPGIASDVVELMDHLNIRQAHIHGYSMGGAITGRILATHPDRFITASFGGQGLRPNQHIDMPNLWLPILAINGENDRPDERTEAMSVLPNFKNVILPGRGHMDAPGDPEYRRVLASFLLSNDVR